jgi:hypothetical protein
MKYELIILSLCFLILIMLMLPVLMLDKVCMKYLPKSFNTHVLAYILLVFLYTTIAYSGYSVLANLPLNSIARNSKHCLYLNFKKLWNINLSQIT